MKRPTTEDDHSQGASVKSSPMRTTPIVVILSHNDCSDVGALTRTSVCDVSAQEAKGLRASDLSGLSDPFAQVRGIIGH